jgi:hypothetical protein
VGSELQADRQNELNQLDLDSISVQRLEKKEDMIEVVVENNADELVSELVSQYQQSGVQEQLGVKPDQLSPLLQRFALSTTTNKPFLREGADFEFEPVISVNQSSLTIDVQQKEPALPQEEPVLDQRIDNGEEKKGQEEKKQASFDQQLTKLFARNQVKQKTERRVKKASVVSRIKKKSKNKQIVFFVGVLVIILMTAVAFSFGSLSVGFQHSQGVVVSNIQRLEQKNYNQLSSIELLGWQARLLDSIFDTQLIEKSSQLNELNQQIVKVSKELAVSQAINSTIILHLFNDTDTSIIEDNADISMYYDNDPETTERELNIERLLEANTLSNASLNELLANFQADLESRNLKLFNSQLQSHLSELLEQVKQLRNRAEASKQLSPLLSNILAVASQQHYYLLLQDDRELRPTGGFLQALAMLVIDDGKIADIQVFPIGLIDQRVLGKLEANEEITQYLGEKQLYLRDANWDPDFSSSATNISWFIREGLNQPVDGLITITYRQIKELLGVIGEVEVEGYTDKLTPQNLYSRLDYYSTEEKEQQLTANFHTAVLKTLLTKLRDISAKQVSQVTDLLYQSLRTQQMTVFLTNSSLSGVLSQLGWSGALIKPECPTRFAGDCYVNYFSQIEANVGVNKVNHLVSSRINHAVSITETEIKHERTIKFTNHAHSSIWPLGSYRSYIRFYMDRKARFDDIEINGGSVDRTTIRESVEHDRKVIGVLIEVPAGESVVLDLRYSTPEIIKAGDSYFFFEQPQPGVSGRLSAISVNHPVQLRAELISPLVDVNQNQIVVTSDVGTGFVAIKFADE